MANRVRQVKVNSKYFPEPVEMNFHTAYMQKKYEALDGREKFWIAFLQETYRENEKALELPRIPVYDSLRANSEFNRRLKAAKADKFNTRPHGPFALFLEWIGIRRHNSEKPVGDS